MRLKGLFFTLLLFSSQLIISQRKGAQFSIYSTIGIKGSAGISLMSNNNIANDQNLDSKMNSFYSSYGGKFSLNYIGIKPMYTLLGFHLDYLIGNFSAKFNDMNYQTTETYNKSVDYKTANLVTTFRYTNTAKRLFFEGGLQYSWFNKISESNSVTDSLFYLSDADYSFSNYYKPHTSVVLGFGTHIQRLFIGLRFVRSMEGMMNDGYAPVSDGLYNSALNVNYETAYVPLELTHLTSIQLTLEYYIPFFAYGRASCGGKGFNFFRGVDTSYYWGKKGNWYD
jgi:hypothetical protein